MEVGLKDKGNKIKFEVQKCSLFGMFRGLMFRRREKAPALLLFDFKKPQRMKIHSFFVFFSFLAIWLDDKNKIIEIKKVKPFEFFVLPEKKFVKLVEVPMNRKYSRIIKLLVGD